MTRPTLTVHQTASLDGRLTLSPDTILLYGDPRWQLVAGAGTDGYRRIKSLHQPQVILEGSGSFVPRDATPDPLPPVEGDAAALYHDFLPESIVNQPGRKWFTAVDSRGRVRWMYKEFPGEEWAGWYLLVLVARQTPPEYLACLRRENVPYLVAGVERVDLGGALAKLASALNVTCVVSTAGGQLNGALLRAGLIDEVSIELCPALIGGTDTPSLFDSPALQPDEQPTRLNPISAQVQADGHVWLRYRVAPA